MMILVTGAGGQVGREIRREAERTGAPIVAMPRTGLDITSPGAVHRMVREIRPAIIVNAAAYTAVDKAEDERERAFRINRDGAANLAQAACDSGISLIHISTDYVFDGTSPQPYKESDPATPIGIYGNSKWAGEEAIRKRLRQHLIVRVSWVFGAYGNNFVKTILRLARDRDELRVVADQTGNPTYAGHIAALILDLCRRIRQKETMAWGTYHFCGRPLTTWHAFAETILRSGRKFGLIDHPVTVRAITTEEYPTRARRPANSALDCHKIEAAFGLSPRNWQAGLDEMVARLAKEED